MRFPTSAPFVLLIAGPAFTTPSSTPPGRGGGPTNVVVVLMDEVGTDFLELFDEVNPYRRDLPYDPTTIGAGHDPAAVNLYVHAPTLASLAANGVTFTNAYSQPMCSPTRAALLTGCHPTRTGVGEIFRWPGPLVGAVTDFGDQGFERTTLPQLLAPAGFQSGVFGKWHLGMPTPDMDSISGSDCYLGWSSIPDRGGFDAWFCVFNGVDNAPAPPVDPVSGYCAGFYNFYANETTSHANVQNIIGTYATVKQFDKALDWCTSVEEPFFCLITPNASHSPFQDLPPASLLTTLEYQSLNTYNTWTRFCASLEAMDAQLGLFLDGLQAADLLDDTLIVVLGDNGTPEVVMEHARRRYSAQAVTQPCTQETIYLLGSDKRLGATYDLLLKSPGSTGDGRFKSTVWEKGVRVPLIVSGPGVVDPGRTSRALVQVEDLFPTIAELVGLAAGDVNGISFTGILDGSVADQDHARDHIWSQRFQRTGHAAVSSEQLLHLIGCSLRIPGEGRFKIVRDALTSQDLFFQLEDSSGDDVDRFETNPLDPTLPAWSGLYGQVADKIDELMSEASSGPACTAPPAPSDCIPVPNVNNTIALISASGMTQVSCNELVLNVTGGVPNQSARFFYGMTSVASMPVGNGRLCICTSGSCNAFRLGIFTLNANGDYSYSLDLGNLPPGGDIQAGDTWYFQLWYRDPVGAGFNFSNSLKIGFCQ